jgi:integrase
MAKNSNGEGSVRQLEDGTWECIIQSKYINPESNSAKPKRIKRRGKTEKEAIKKCKQALQVWEKMYESNMLKKVDKTRTFGSYMEEFIEKEVKPGLTGSSYKSYIYTMNANFYNYKISKLQLNMINTVEFEIFFDTIIHEKSRKTASLPIQLCKRLSTYLYGKSLLSEDYAAFARTKKEKKDEFFRKEETDIRKEVFTYEDIIKFYESYKSNVSEYSAAVVLILETMMRGQELLALTLDDIDLENNIITIRSAVSERFIDNDKTKGLEKYVKVPKNEKQRIIHITPLAKEIIEYMINQVVMKSRANPHNLLFPSYIKNGKMRSMDAFEIQFKNLCNKLGVDRDVRSTTLPDGRVINKGLSVHALRHTAITLANTAPNSNVINTALMAGHTAIRTENIYTHTNVEALKQIKTASDLVLNLNEKNESKEIPDDDELYKMYLKLKNKFDTQ